MQKIDCILGAPYGKNRGYIVATKGDTAVVKFSLRDLDGDEIDNADVTSAVLTVAEGQWVSTSVLAGGESLFNKSIGSGITRDPDLYSLVATLAPADTASIEAAAAYYELVVTLANGQVYTASSGLVKSYRTLRADGF